MKVCRYSIENALFIAKHGYLVQAGPLWLSYFGDFEII